MLAPICYSNYTHLIVIAYFLSYCISLMGLCAFFAPYLSVTPNIYQLSTYLNYSKQKTKLFAVVFVSFLGLPPLFAFAPKFACLTQVWVYGGWVLFFLVLTASFLSFALYLQVFDVLFAKRKQGQVLKNSQPKKLNLRAFRTYEVNTFLSCTVFFIVGGVFFFKDLVILLSCMW